MENFPWRNGRKHEYQNENFDFENEFEPQQETRFSSEKDNSVEKVQIYEKNQFDAYSTKTMKNKLEGHF